MTTYLSTFMRGYIGNYAGLPTICWQGILLVFMESVAIGICFFLSIYFVSLLHMNITAASMLISCYGVGTVIGGIAAGKLSDRFSPKIVSVSCLLLQSLSFLLLTTVESLAVLAGIMLMIGVCSYGFTTSNSVWILNQCKNSPEIQLKAINISRAALNLGLGISGATIGFLGNIGFILLFEFSSFIFLMSSIYLLVCTHDENKKSQLESLESPTHKVTQQRNDKKILFLTLGCLFAIGLIIAQLGSTYPIYIQKIFPERGIQAVSILFVIDTIMIILFQVPLLNLLRGFNKLFLVGVGAFLMGIGMALLTISYLFAIAIISCVIWTTGEMIFLATAQFVCYQRGGKNKKGQSIGMTQTAAALSRIMGPTAGGYIYYYFGGNILWYLSFFIGILCFTACSYAKKLYC